MIVRAVAVLFVLAAVGCTRESSAAKSDEKLPLLGRKRGVEFDLGADSYAPRVVSTGGSLVGTITLEGAVPLATAAVTTDQSDCKTNGPGAVEAGAKGALSNAIVWIADAKSGKALPTEKRVVISSDNCAIEPRAQVATVGSTVNFFNDDKALHRIVFLRAGTNDTIVAMPFFNDGQVVPTEKVAKTPGVVDVRCVRHPWMRGSLVVFDHPYYAVTERDGRYRLDSLLPGDYKLMVWHEGLKKPIERKITIHPGSAEKVDVALNLGAL